MDTLRATNLSSVLSNNDKKANQMISLNKDNVLQLVKTFSELSKHEKILFLINIREFTCEQSITTPTPPEIKQEGVADEQNHGTQVSTPQSLRLSRTSNWLQKTFIQDTQVALPKEEVYGLYKHEFIRQNEKPISTADFGKLMRQVFPDVKARRLGQRGQSKYCYANIRKRSEIEKPALPTPLPQNELISWAKNKFNIDFGDAGQVVSYLKCENTSSVYRKRRASCGAGVLSKGKAKSTARSASVSVLELKDDPLMIQDTESLEIGSYFENSSSWPQLRSLLTESDLTGGGNPSKKKRHSSSVQFEFIKPEMHPGSGLLRSQSVPVTEMSFMRNQGIDEMQSTSTSSIFDELGSNGNNDGSNNPLFSSAVTSVGSNKNPSTSSCSSNSSGLFESIDVGVVNGDVVVGSSGNSGLGSLMLSSSVGGPSSDVFFDSVFDLMMSDCQN